MKKKLIAIIPVRGGSKGILKKNLSLLGEKSLIEWTLEPLLKTKVVDEIVFSTDDAEIKDHLKKYPVRVIDRPAAISTDVASSEAAILYTLAQLPYQPETVLFAQVTSPFRAPDVFARAYAEFFEKKYDSMLSVVENDFFIWKETPRVFSVNYDYNNRPMRQSREKEWIENGSFYFFNTDGFLKSKNRLFGNIGLYAMHGLGSRLDINTEEDLQLARLFLQHFCEKNYELG